MAPGKAALPTNSQEGMKAAKLIANDMELDCPLAGCGLNTSTVQVN